MPRLAPHSIPGRVGDRRHRKEHGLLYDAYEMQRQMLAGASNWATIGARMLNNPALPIGYFGMGPVVASALEVFAHLYEQRGKPAFARELLQQREMQSRLLVQRRYAHEARDRKTQAVAAIRDEPRDVVERTAREGLRAACLGHRRDALGV